MLVCALKRPETMENIANFELKNKLDLMVDVCVNEQTFLRILFW